MSAGRILKLVGLAALIFVGLLVPWVIFFGATTDGGECSFEEVECSSLGEFVDSGLFVALSLPALGAIAVALAWLITRPRLPR